jgi:hypothetical protein
MCPSKKTKLGTSTLLMTPAIKKASLLLLA